MSQYYNFMTDLGEITCLWYHFYMYFLKVSMMPANTEGGIQELMKLPKITKKEDGILLQY